MVQPVIVRSVGADRKHVPPLVIHGYSRIESFLLVTNRSITHILGLARQDEITARQRCIGMNVRVVAIGGDSVKRARQKVQAPYQGELEAAQTCCVAIRLVFLPDADRARECASVRATGTGPLGRT